MPTVAQLSFVFQLIWYASSAFVISLCRKVRSQGVWQPGEIEEEQRGVRPDGRRVVGEPRGGAAVDIRMQALSEAAVLGRHRGVSVRRVGGLLASETPQLLVEQPLARPFARSGAAVVDRGDAAGEERPLEP